MRLAGHSGSAGAAVDQVKRSFWPDSRWRLIASCSASGNPERPVDAGQCWIRVARNKTPISRPEPRGNLAAMTAPAGSLPDPATLRRFDKPGPRYTSYPTADRFVEAFGPERTEALPARRHRVADKPSAFIIRTPPVLQHHLLLLRLQQGHHQGPRALRQVHPLPAEEKDLVVAEMGGAQRLEQLHWGGGTPTFLNAGTARADGRSCARFELARDGEYSIEVDPRSADPITGRGAGRSWASTASRWACRTSIRTCSAR